MRREEDRIREESGGENREGIGGGEKEMQEKMWRKDRKEEGH